MARALKARAERRLCGFWVRAALGGVVFVLDAESHQALIAELQSLPIILSLRSIEVDPMVEHPPLAEAAAGG